MLFFISLTLNSSKSLQEARSSTAPLTNEGNDKMQFIIYLGVRTMFKQKTMMKKMSNNLQYLQYAFRHSNWIVVGHVWHWSGSDQRLTSSSCHTVAAIFGSEAQQVNGWWLFISPSLRESWLCSGPYRRLPLVWASSPWPSWDHLGGSWPTWRTTRRKSSGQRNCVYCRWQRTVESVSSYLPETSTQLKLITHTHNHTPVWCFYQGAGYNKYYK